LILSLTLYFLLKYPTFHIHADVAIYPRIHLFGKPLQAVWIACG
jgi:hypothetical protein